MLFDFEIFSSSGCLFSVWGCCAATIILISLVAHNSQRIYLSQSQLSLLSNGQNRGSEKQQPHATATSSSGNATKQQAGKKKSKKKKKKKSGAADDADDVQAPARKNVDMTVVKNILKKFNMEDQDEMEVYDAVTTNQSRGCGFLTGPQRMERQFLLELAHDNFRKLASFIGVDSSGIPEPTFVAKTNEPPTVDSVLSILFNFMKKEEVNEDAAAGEEDKENTQKKQEKREQLWTLLDDATTAPILKAALSSSVDALKWFEEYASDALEAFASQQVREEDVTVLIDAGVSVSAKSVAALFSKLPEGAGHAFNNKTARILCDKSNIFMETKAEYQLAMDAISKTVGKQCRVDGKLWVVVFCFIIMIPAS